MPGRSNLRAPQNTNRNVYEPPVQIDPFELAPNGLEERLDPQWPVGTTQEASRYFWPPVSFSRTAEMVSKLMRGAGRQITPMQSANIEDRRGQTEFHDDIDKVMHNYETFDRNRAYSNLPRAAPGTIPWGLDPFPGNINSHFRPNTPGRRGDEIEALLDYLGK